MAFDAFLKISGIDGESQDDKHKNWIELLSYSHGVNQQSTGLSTTGSISAERASFHDFTITKELDKATPKLFAACASGEHFATINVEVCRAGGDKVKYMEYELSDVLITSFRPVAQSKDATGTLPTEVVSMSAGQIKMTYTETDKATGKALGAVPAGWNLKTNKKL
jgi:type VI secretion system secreted protein Hcp